MEPPVCSLHLLSWETVLDKIFVDRASFADRFSWTTSPWHRLMPFWGCCCCSTHSDLQNFIVSSQWLCMAIVNHVLSKASVINYHFIYYVWATFNFHWTSLKFVNEHCVLSPIWNYSARAVASHWINIHSHNYFIFWFIWQEIWRYSSNSRASVNCQHTLQSAFT